MINVDFKFSSQKGYEADPDSKQQSQVARRPPSIDRKLWFAVIAWQTVLLAAAILAPAIFPKTFPPSRHGQPTARKTHSVAVSYKSSSRLHTDSPTTEEQAGSPAGGLSP